jgi:hypothetical protein
MLMARKTRQTAAATRRAALEPELIIESGVTVDLTITMENLGKMVRTQARDTLLRQREAVQAVLQERRDGYAKLEADLQKAAEGLCAQACVAPNIGAVCCALTDFTGNAYVAKSSDMTCDVAAKEVRAEVGIYAAEDVKREYAAAEVSATRHLPFTPGMHELVEKLAEQRALVEAAQKDLDKVNRRLADLPHLVDQAEALMTRAYLERRLKTGSDLLAVLEQVESRAALALPALPAPAAG